MKTVTVDVSMTGSTVLVVEVNSTAVEVVSVNLKID